MIQVYVGATRSKKLIARLKDMGWGRVWVREKPTPYEGEPWFFDNGAYSDYLAGNSFDTDVFLKHYGRALELDFTHQIDPPQFGVVPDIVGRGHKSLAFSVRWRHRLRGDWMWYLVVQDGMEAECVRPFVGDFDGIFLGGTDNFKASASMWCKMAHDHGKPFHYGRVSTPKKLDHAIEVGADSCDSAFPLWSMERFDHFADCWQNGNPQFKLFEKTDDSTA